MPGRKQRYGADRLVATSVHIPFAYLERIDVLKVKPSRFIREAVGEKLEREEGFIASMKRQEAIVERLEADLHVAQSILDDFIVKHSEWKQKKEMGKVREMILVEYMTGNYHSEADLYNVVQTQIETQLDLKKIVHDVWIKIKMENG